MGGVLVTCPEGPDYTGNVSNLKWEKEAREQPGIIVSKATKFVSIFTG